MLLDKEGICNSRIRNSNPSLHPQHLPQEGPFVGGFFDDFGEGSAGTMTGAGFDTDEDGWGTFTLGVAFLESSGEFEAVGGDDAVVVVGGGDESGGILGAGLQVV